MPALFGLCVVIIAIAVLFAREFSDLGKQAWSDLRSRNAFFLIIFSVYVSYYAESLANSMRFLTFYWFKAALFLSTQLPSFPYTFQLSQYLLLCLLPIGLCLLLALLSRLLKKPAWRFFPSLLWTSWLFQLLLVIYFYP